MKPSDLLETPASAGSRRPDARAALADAYLAVRRFSLALCEPLETEDFVGQSMEEASPIKWHLAHTSWFFETFLLKENRPSYRSAVPEYAYLFNSYYNAAGPMHCRDRRGVITRPTVSQTMAYRRHIDRAMRSLLEDAPDAELARLAPVVTLGLHHEQQHQELMLTDLKHLFAQNPLLPVYRERDDPPARDPGPAGWVEMGEGVHEIGHAGGGFAYDNEGPRHRQFVEPFALADRLVTNAEFLEFMEDGGYRDAAHWLSLGWKTVQAEQWEAPLYWFRKGGVWHQFTLHGARPIDPHEPVCHVSFFEADAFARWAGARLPTEAEWEIAAAHADPAEGNFVDDGRCHPSGAPEKNGALVRQLFGDVWEWTASSYRPYPGYRPPAGALGEYNGKFMCNQMVLRGGSCATSRDHIRATYRNFFPPDKRWQFSGIRLAKDMS